MPWVHRDADEHHTCDFPPYGPGSAELHDRWQCDTCNLIWELVASAEHGREFILWSGNTVFLKSTVHN